jgi:hypothetical protein
MYLLNKQKMASYEKVVGLLGANLASFLELAKKFLIDWAIEPKKLLHLFQNMRKEDLIGLIDGTHEIKTKAVEAKPDVVASEKFGLLLDLGVITVPDDFAHSTHLATFSKNNRKKFYYYNDNITDKNFNKATVQLTPGRKLRVKAFKQTVSGNTTSEERMAFLKTQNNIFTGAVGASLVFEQKRDLLPKGKWYCSFDEKEALWKDSDGYHRVPRVDANSDGDFEFGLGYFEYDWYADYVLLCFCDESLDV